MKYKPNSVRTYDADGFRRRAACVCVRDDSEFEVLLVSGSKDPGTWVVPGGGVEPTEDEGVAALREVQEEAGVRGKLRRQLGIFESEDGKTRTNVFVMVVTEMLDDWEDATAIGRRRKWFSLDEARRMLGLYKPQQQSYLQTLGSRHHTNGSSSSSSTPATPSSLLTASSMY